MLWPEGQHAVFPAEPGQKAMVNGLAQFGILMLLLLAAASRRPDFRAGPGRALSAYVVQALGLLPGHAIVS